MIVTQRTPTQRLADAILGRSVDEFVAERRTAGRSWRHVARDLFEATDGQIDISHETVRLWCGETTAVAS